MIIKDVRKKDMETIYYLNSLQIDFKLNNFDNMIIEKLAFDEDGKPVAYGIVKHMAEAIILVNPGVSKLTRARAMRELMKYAELGAEKANCSQLHCFVKDSGLADSLVRHFGFIKSQDSVLAKEL